MSVKVSFMGVPDLSGTEETVELSGLTLEELSDRLGERHGDGLSERRNLLAFVNGKSAGSDWGSVRLQDGDRVLFVAPISGG